MDASSELTLKNKNYLKVVKHYLWEAYQLDQPKKDVTTRYFLRARHKKITAQISAQEEGIIAGMEEVIWFLEKLGIKILKFKKDGKAIKKGEVVLKIEGRMGTVLGAERTLLNALQRMSGIATKTEKMSGKLSKPIKLLATRKTLWGWMDKKAVNLGGGGTHRLDLADAILVKDNHIALAKDLKKSLKRSLKRINKHRFVEIEVESETQLKTFLEIYRELKSKLNIQTRKIILMLDNFKPNQIKKWVTVLKKEGLLIEASGGINDKNISRYSIPGLTAISSSAMTMAAPPLNLNLEILKS